jgi:hypothetical protein
LVKTLRAPSALHVLVVSSEYTPTTAPLASDNAGPPLSP